jgi:hypothetical protein
MSEHDTDREQQAAPPDEEQSSESAEGLSEEQQKARKSKEEAEHAKETMREIEQNPPEKLEDWPDDMAKYETFGGPEEGQHTYDEGPEAQLGPSSLRHHEGGKVTIEGEEVDDPEEYKGDPVPGGPTDPNAPEGPEKEQDSDEG